MSKPDTITQEAYDLYTTETAKKVNATVSLKHDEPKKIGEAIREQTNNSEWYSCPLKTIQFAETDPTDPAWTPHWGRLAGEEDITWDKALEEAVYICLFNDVMTKLKDRE